MQNLIKTTFENQIAILELDDPSANTITFDLLKELEECVLNAACNTHLKGLIFIGKGEKFFSGGVNIGMLLTAGRQHNSHFILYAVEILDLIEALNIPVITIINGNITGGGLELALIAHHRIAKEGNYNIGFPEVRLGVIPGMGGTQRLSRLIGEQLAMELITLGELISPSQALKIGLVDEILPAENFRENALNNARQLIEKSSSHTTSIAPFAGEYRRIIQRGFITFCIKEGIATININEGAEDFLWSDVILGLNSCLLDIRADEDIYCLLIKLNCSSFGIPDNQKRYDNVLFKYIAQKLTNYPKVVAISISKPMDSLEFELALCCDYRFSSESLLNCPDPQEINIDSPRLNRFRGILPADETSISMEKLTSAGFFKCTDTPELWLKRFVPPLGAGQAIGYAKLAITQGCQQTQAAGQLLERHLQEQLFVAPDSKEGMQAYLEKRKPYFVGAQWEARLTSCAGQKTEKQKPE